MSRGSQNWGYHFGGSTIRIRIFLGKPPDDLQRSPKAGGPALDREDCMLDTCAEVIQISQSLDSLSKGGYSPWH